MGVYSLPPIPEDITDRYVLHQWLFELFKKQLTLLDEDSFAPTTRKSTRVTTTYQILEASDDVIICNTDSAGYTVTLSAASTAGRSFKIVNSGSSGNTLTLAPSGAEHLIGLNSNFLLLDGEALEITYNATDGWY